MRDLPCTRRRYYGCTIKTSETKKSEVTDSMGRITARRIKGMSWKEKISLILAIITMVFSLSAVTGIGLQEAAFANTMIHNSDSVGKCSNSTYTNKADCLAHTETWTSRWPGAGGWGVPAGKYGEFVCETCHIKNAANIKRIRSTITTPNTSKGALPGDGQPIDFTKTKGNSGDVGTMGDDSNTSPSGRATSNRICEICHTYDAIKVDGVNVHAYSSPVDLGNHQNANAKDCMVCHKHATAFKASCSSCHGKPPTVDTAGVANGLTLHEDKKTGSLTAGAHNKHADILGYSCETCHNGGVMPELSTVTIPDLTNQWNISIGFNYLGGLTSGTYTGQSNVSYNQTAGTGTLTCSAIYCHGTTMAPNGGTNTTPVWNDSATGACGTCHGATAAAPPRRGAHYRHAGSSTDIGHDYACILCHNSAQHVNNKSEVAFTTDPKVIGGSYSGTDTMMDPYGSCSNIYCHSSVQGAGGLGGPAVYANPNWSEKFADDPNCSLCHQGPVDHYTAPLAGNTTGSHTKHGSRRVYCATCHANDVNEDPAGCVVCHTVAGPNDSHANYGINVNIVNMFGGTYSGSAAPGDGYGSCTNVYCHSSGQSSTGAALAEGEYKPVNWGDPIAFTCASCHKDMDTDATATGSHAKHAQMAGIACATCHNGYTETTIAVNTHVNKLINLSFSGQGIGTTYSQGNTHGQGNGYGTCGTSYCHSNGSGTYKAPTWGGASTGCNFCHDASPTSGGHAIHVKTAATAYGSTSASTTGGVYNFGCGNCHPKDIANHANGTLDIILNDGVAGDALKVLNSPSAGRTGTGTSTVCNLTYCHSNGAEIGVAIVAGASPVWSGYAGTDRCAMCHGNAPSSGSHQYHVMASIHFDNVFTGTTGLKPATTRADITGQIAALRPHGNAATATTVSCNICHNGTVTSTSNALATQCVTCHNTTGALDGDAVASIDTASTLHLNGTVDVSLQSGPVYAKSQIRDDEGTVTGAPAGWTRNAGHAGYKVSGAYDVATINAGDWASSSKTCTTACHMGQQSPAWGTPINCFSCHTSLPH